MNMRVVCLGGGGHAAVVIDTLQAMALSTSPAIEIAGFTDPDSNAPPVLDVPRIGSDKDLSLLVGTYRLTHFIVAIGSTRGGSDRPASLFAQAQAAGIEPLTAVHPSAVVAASVSIAAGSIIMAGAIVQPRARIGRNVIVNTRAVIDHDCTVGDHAHIAPGAILSGGVTIEDCCHIGAGSTILQNIRIARGATVAAGATVVHDVAAGLVVKGTPARAYRGS